MNDNCISCGELIDGHNKIGRYVFVPDPKEEKKDNTPENQIFFTQIAQKFGVDEGYICHGCWAEIKDQDDVRLIDLFHPFEVELEQ